MWIVRDRDNREKLVIHSLEYNGEWMGECSVSVDIESDSPVDFRLGDWLDYRGERFEINYDPSVIKSAPAGIKGDGFKYSGVKFNSLSDELTRCGFYDIVINDNNIHYTALPKFSFFAPTVKELADRIQANLDRFSEQNGSERWIVEVHPEFSGKTDVNVSVDNVKVWDMLKVVVDDFEAYFTIKDRRITIGAPGVPAAHVFRYGKGNGLYEIERSGENDQEIVTRLRAYGSTRNMPIRYYQRLSGFRAKDTIAKISDVNTPTLKTVRLTNMSFIDENKLVDKTVSGDSVFGWLAVEINGKTYAMYYHRNDKSGSHYMTIGQSPQPQKPSRYIGNLTMVARDMERMKEGDTVYFSACRDDIPSTNKQMGKDYIPNNLALKNLMLPGFPDTTQDPYIDSDNIPYIGVLEGSVFFDGSDEDLPEIYPSIEGMTAEDIKAAGHNTTAEGALDELMAAEQIADDGVGKLNPEGTESTPENDKYTFKVWIKDLGFDINDYLTSQAATLSFKSGKLTGREFEIKRCEKKESGYYELELNRVYDSDIQLWFPYNDYNATEGDRFVLLYIEMPEVYIDAASQRLYKAAAEWLAKNDYPRSVYSPKVDEIFMARQHDEAMASGLTSLHDTIKEGMQMLFEDEDLGIDGAIIIDTLTIKEGDGSIPTYEVTLKEEKTVGTIERVQNKIDSLARGIGQGAGGYNAQQIQEFIRAYGARYFLSKLTGDRTPYQLAVGDFLTAEKGMYFGKEFISGLIGGLGGRIDGDGNAELDSLTLRKFLEVPELRYNRTEVIVGNEWQAPGAGIVESYEHQGTTDVTQPDGKVATCNVGWINLKLEEGEIGSLSVGDFCMGIWHYSRNELNIGTGTPGGEGAVDENGNHTEDADDNNGNFRFAGFRTLYFYVYGVEGERNERLHVRTRSFYPAEPVEGLHFVAYGNDAKDAQGNYLHPERQQSAYRTRTYTRYLAGVSGWTWNADNIMSQFGDLSGLRLNGEDMSGYSAYLNNVYFSGVIRQVDAPLRLSYTMLGDTYIGYRGDGAADSCVIQLTAMQGVMDATPGMTVTCRAADGAALAAGAVSIGRYSETTGTLNVQVNPQFISGYSERTLVITATYTPKPGASAVTATQSVLFRDVALLKGDKGDTGESGKDGSSYSPNMLTGTKTLPSSWGTDNSGDCNKTVRPNSDGFVEYTDTITSASAQHTGYAWIQDMVEGGMSRFVNGRTYTLSFDYRSSREFRLGLRFRDADNSTATQVHCTGTFAGSETWKRGSVTFTPEELTAEHTRLLLLEIIDNTSAGDTVSLRKFCITEGSSAAWSPAESEMLGKDAVTYEWQVSPGVIRCNADGTLPGGTASVNVRCFRIEGDQRTELTIPQPPLILANTVERIQYSIAWKDGKTEWKDISYGQTIDFNDSDGRDTYPNIHLRVARYTYAITPTVEVMSAEHVVGYVCDGQKGDRGEDGQNGGVGPAGAVMRMSGLWQENMSYEDGTVADAQGVRWIDVVYVRNSSGTEYWYRCTRRNTSSSANRPSASSSWWGAISNLGDMMADVLIANRAFINNLTTREVVFVNSSGNIVGRVGSPLPGNGAVMYTGQLDQDNVQTDNATYLLDVTGYTRYGQFAQSHVRIWPDYGSTGGARICAYTAGGTADGKEVVAIDGTAHEIGGAYGIVNTISRTLTALSFTSDKTYPYPGKLELPAKVTATLRMTVPVTLICTSRKETTGTGTGLVRQSQCRGKFRIFRNGVLWKEYTTNWCASTSISQGEDTSDARLDQTIVIDVSLTEAGIYTFEAESELTDMGLDPVTGIRHSATVSFGATEVNIKAGSDPKAFLGANGLLVSNSTQDYFKAGIDNGTFGMEISTGQQSGLRVTEAEGVRMKGKTGAYDVEPFPATVGYVTDANTCYRDRLGVSVYVTDGDHTMNLPTGAASKFGRLTVTTFSASNILQEFHTFSHPMQIWTRIKLSGTWRAWTQIV